MCQLIQSSLDWGHKTQTQTFCSAHPSPSQMHAVDSVPTCRLILLLQQIPEAIFGLKQTVEKNRQVLKLLERVLDARIRRRVGDFGEEQQWFRKGREEQQTGTYVLRQMVEKRLDVQGSMALGFVDLEKAFDTVPREMVMATLRWMGIPEAEVRMVEGMYEKTTARVVVGEGASEDFEVKFGLRPGSMISPLLLFIAVLDLISRKTVMEDAMKKLLYADDLALVANGKQELQETMEE